MFRINSGNKRGIFNGLLIDPPPRILKEYPKQGALGLHSTVNHIVYVLIIIYYVNVIKIACTYVMLLTNV